MAHRSITVPCECLKQRTAACTASGRTECFRAGIGPERIAEMVCTQFKVNP